MSKRKRKLNKAQRAKLVRDGLKIGYEEVPPNKLRFYFKDTVNNCILHALVVQNADVKTQNEINVAYQMFKEQVQELLK